MGVTQQPGGWYYWVKRVPRRFQGLVLGQNGKPVQQVRHALHTQCKQHAKLKAAKIEALRMAEWEALLLGKTEDARTRYQAAVALAEAHGFTYYTNEELRAGPDDRLMERVLAATSTPGKHVPVEITRAILGAEPRVLPTMAALLTEYVDLTRTRHLKKSDGQKHRWLLPRKRAVRNFETVTAHDRPSPLTADQITRPHVLMFRDFWSRRVEAGTHSAQSANKEFGYLAEMFGTWAELTGHDLPNPFRKLRLDGAAPAKVPAFSRDWIKLKIFAPAALDGLNDEARDVLLVMINTGLRPSEIIDAPLEDFRTTDNIPHLVVAAHGRELKVAHTARDIPLTGVSLEAARRIVARGGIQRYGGKTGGWSANVNKYLGNNGLKETPRHTAYSLRHSMEDALLDAGVDDRVRADILGHKYNRPNYGTGGGLAARRAALERIAL